MITMIYEDIFEAIRAFTPNHPFLSLKDSPETTVEIPKPLLFMLGVGEAPCSKFIAASKTYTDSLIQLPMPRTFEEAFIRMGNDIPTHYFRGENCTGRFCIPATFRPVNPPLAEPGFETVIDFLQLLDFIITPFKIMFKFPDFFFVCCTFAICYGITGVFRHFPAKQHIPNRTHCFMSEIGMGRAKQAVNCPL